VWAVTLSLIANEDNVAESDLSEIISHVFGGLRAGIDSDFVHDHMSKRVNALGIQSSTVHIKPIPCHVSHDPLSYLTADRILGAEKQHSFLIHNGLDHVLGQMKTASKAR
jgi:hypothetical protein